MDHRRSRWKKINYVQFRMGVSVYVIIKISIENNGHASRINNLGEMSNACIER